MVRTDDVAHADAIVHAKAEVHIMETVVDAEAVIPAASKSPLLVGASHDKMDGESCEHCSGTHKRQPHVTFPARW